MSDALSDIIDDSIANKPEVNPDVILEEISNGSGTTECSGDSGGGDGGSGTSGVFDPTIHAVDADGKPVLTKTGKFRKARINKKLSRELMEPGCRQAATAVVSSIVVVMQCLGGEEAEPIKREGFDERKNMEDAWTEYFIYLGIDKVTPILGVIIATGAYVVPRCTMPKTKSMISRLASSTGKTLKGWFWK